MGVYNDVYYSYTNGTVTTSENIWAKDPESLPGKSIVLKLGDRGEEVTALQNRLKELGYYDYTADGVCDFVTCDFVELFQKTNGLDPDGIVREKMMELMFSQKAISYSK